MSTELSIRPDQTQFDTNQMAALRSLGVTNASDADVALFFHQAARTGLDPFARQIYLINRGGKQTIQVGIDGFRLIRDRKGTYRGHTEEWCGQDGKWRDVWLGRDHPSAARVQVYVEGYTVPVVGIATWDEYAQIGRDGKPQSVWASKPALMLAKCAEALALRKAFPQDLSGLYTTDEIPEAEQDADGVHVVTTMQADSRKPPKAQQTRDKLSVWEQWHTIVQACDDMDALIRAHDDAAKRGVLDTTAVGRTGSIEEVFLARRTELLDAAQQAAAGEPEPEIMLDGADVEYPESLDGLPF